MIEIVESTMRHCKKLSETLREEDKQEAVALGKNPKKAVFESYRSGYHRKTGLIDGKVGAMWGLSGQLLGPGRPYLITSIEINKISPLKFMRIYKQELQDLLGICPVLENYVDANYHGAVRALKIAGFHVSKPMALGPQEALFRKFSLE